MLDSNINLVNIMLFYLLPITVLLMIAYGVKTSNSNRKKLVQKNKFIHENQKILNKVIEENSKYHDNCLLICGINLIIFIAAILLSFYYAMQRNLIFVGFLMMVITFIILVSVNYKYKVHFKEKIVKKVIQCYNPNLNYYPDKGFGYIDYELCQFPEQCDIFSSEDLIVDKNSSFVCSDILVQSESYDSEGRVTTKVEYSGALARMDIKECQCFIQLGSIKRNFFFADDFISIKFENDEFNKLFSVYTDNELLTYKLLTPDVMEEFVKLKKSTYGDIDIRIINDKLFVRFLSGDGFVPNLFNKKSERNSIISSIAVLDEVISVMNNVKKIIDEKNSLE